MDENDIKNIMALKAALETDKKAEEENEPKEGTIFDILNAAIPFMPEKDRKMCFYLVKLMEIESFDGKEGFEKDDASKEQRREAFLKRVSPFLSNEERNTLNTIIKLNQLKNIMGGNL